MKYGSLSACLDTDAMLDDPDKVAEENERKTDMAVDAHPVILLHQSSSNHHRGHTTSLIPDPCTDY